MAFTLLGFGLGTAVLGLGAGVGAEEADEPESVLSLGRGALSAALFTSLLKVPTGSLDGDFIGLVVGAFGGVGTGGGAGL